MGILDGAVDLLVVGTFDNSTHHIVVPLHLAVRSQPPQGHNNEVILVRHNSCAAHSEL